MCLFIYSHFVKLINRQNVLVAPKIREYRMRYLGAVLINKTPKVRTVLHVHAVQCDDCYKWRKVSEEEYEEIGSKLGKEPFYCYKKPNVTCADPADFNYDNSRIWVMDKPNIPKTPIGFQRKVTLRNDFSKVDVQYMTPDGKRIRSSIEAKKFLEQCPEYNLSVSDFSFVIPKLMRNTIPKNIGKKGSVSGAKRVETTPEKDA